MKVNAYIPNESSNTVSVINTAASPPAVVGSAIPVGNEPNGAVVTPDGSKAYITNSSDGTVSVINTATAAVIGTITVGNNPQGFGKFIGTH